MYLITEECVVQSHTHTHTNRQGNQALNLIRSSKAEAALIRSEHQLIVLMFIL